MLRTPQKNLNQTIIQPDPYQLHTSPDQDYVAQANQAVESLLRGGNWQTLQPQETHTGMQVYNVHRDFNPGQQEQQSMVPIAAKPLFNYEGQPPAALTQLYKSFYKDSNSKPASPDLDIT